MKEWISDREYVVYDEPAPAKYRCKHCGKVVERRSTKAWIKSTCEASGYKTVHLMRVEQAQA